MHSLMRQFVRVATASTLAVVFMIPQDSLAQSHVVSLAELQSATVAATQARERNIETLRAFVSSPTARANKAQADFAAGNLSDRDLIIILIAVAALILIIVAVR